MRSSRNNPAPVAPEPIAEPEPPIVNPIVNVENATQNDNDSNTEFQSENDVTVVVPDEEFALTPALASKKKVLNYTDAGESKIFKIGTAKLSVDIDGTPENLNLVLAAIEQRAVISGWLDTVLSIYVGNGECKELLTNYGDISMDEIRHHVKQYIHSNVRAAQDSMMLYTCLSNSMTQETRQKILLYKDEYYIDGRTPSGALLLKVLIRESYIDTNATVKFIRENLSSLDVYMVKVDSDVEKFNQYVYSNLLKLKAHGQTTMDLMSNLF